MRSKFIGDSVGATENAVHKNAAQKCSGPIRGEYFIVLIQHNTAI